MGFSIRLAPGVRVRVSSRGLRTSVGPRTARLHVGAGRPGISTGFGPFGFYTPLGGSSSHRPTGRSTGSLSHSLAVVQRGPTQTPTQAEKERQARELIAALTSILDLHHQDFPAATRPVAPPPAVPPLEDVEGRHVDADLKGVGLLDFAGRKAARARAHADAAADWQGLQATAQRRQRDYQEDLDKWWDRLLANDPSTVLGALATAFEDNEAAAAPLGVDQGVASIVVHVPDPDAVPERMPGTTPAGNLTLRKLTKRERSDFYTSMVAGYLLVTAKEAFAVAPGLAAVTLVAVRRGRPDAYGHSAAEALMLVRLERARLAGIRWEEAASGEILNAAASEQAVNQFGQTHELRPLDPQAYPDLAPALKAIDLDEADEQGVPTPASPAPALGTPTPASPAPFPWTPTPGPAQPLPPAGWYRDPSERHQLRFWDGGQWTQRVSDDAVEGADPV